MSLLNLANSRKPLNTDLGLLLLRLVLGAVFIYHGAQKVFGVWGGTGLSGEEGFIAALTGMGMPMPSVAAPAAALAELLGGVALVTGLFLRLMLLPLAGTMAVAAFVVHGSAFGLQNSGMEYALTLLVGCVTLFLTGGGRLALRLPERRKD